MSVRPFGVIEGFYGDPWSTAERLTCIDMLAANGANTFVWAPKSEPRHRDAWSEPFTRSEIEDFATLIARSPDVMVSVGLTPGGDATIADVVDKMRPVADAGCRTITLCFDDLPVLKAGRRHREIVHGIRDALGVAVWLVPTHYCGVSSSPYLEELIDGLDGDVLVMWTGETVVTDRIDVEHVEARTRVMGGRPPLLWDNVPVNDAMMTGALHMGPYVGRERGVAGTCAGVLLNPMISMRASVPTVESACAWWRGEDPLHAWRECVERDGWRVLAESTAFPGDVHWPGEAPGRDWLLSVTELSTTDDPEIDPWIESARRGARICLAALEVVDGMARGTSAADLIRSAVALSGVSAWLQEPARTLGAGPRVRPAFTQDESGRFSPTESIVVPTTSIVESHVRSALDALSRAERPH